jgi:hypothetical protein
MSDLLDILVPNLSSILICLNVKPFTRPTSGPLCPIAYHGGLRIFSVCKVVASEIFMQTVGSCLCLIMKFMKPTEPFDVSTLSLASKIPVVNAKPDDSVLG